MRSVNEKSSLEFERKLNKTLFSQNQTYTNFLSLKSEKRLPSLDVSHYYKKIVSQSKQQEFFDLLHLPLQEEQEETEIKDQKKENQTFTSFNKIYEQNRKSLLDNDDPQEYDYLNYKSERECNEDITKSNTSRNFVHLNKTYYKRNFQTKTEFSCNDQLNFELNHNRFILERLKDLDENKTSENEKYIYQKYKEDQFIQNVQKLIKHYPSHFKKAIREQQQLDKIHKENQKNQKSKLNKDKSVKKISSKRGSQFPNVDNLNDFVFDQQITKVFWHANVNDSLWKPDFRYQSSIIQEGNKAYLYGGIGMSVKNELIEIDLNDYSFKVIKDNGDKPSKRYANGMVSFTYPLNIQLAFNPLSNNQKPSITNENTFVVIQGQMPYNPQLKIKECQSDVKVFNIEKSEWKNLRTNVEGMPEPRRSFGCCVVGKGIVVYGGLNGKQNYLKDAYYLNLTTCKWLLIKTTNDVFPDGLGYNQMLAVYTKPQAVRVNDYRQEINNQKKIKQEGLYVLGGCYQDSKFKELVFYSHFLAILKVDCGEPSWIIPETAGEQPNPRIMHTAVWNKQLHAIIIFGGRNDLNENPYYNDMHLLKLDNLQWIQLQFAHPPVPRAGHCAISYETKMLVIGGINMEGYLPMTVEIAELDRGKVRQMIELEKLNQKTIEDTKKNKKNEFRPQSMKKNKKIVKTVEEDIEDKTFAEETKEKMLIKSRIEFLKYSNFSSEVPIPGQRLSIRPQKSMNSREFKLLIEKRKTKDI